MMGLLVRFLISAVVLLVASWIIPGFFVAGFVGAIIAALVIALLGYAVEAIFGEKISGGQRGLVGFIIAAAVIWVSQLLVPGAIQVSILGALIAALVIGVADAFLPTPLDSRAIKEGEK
ncbi:phage holin family protein [Heliorestis acidaminivorans]|uniref:Phage holin family protein n=1 Tax=Heliorestis acidaminivorans TaxID=553427 RepID=A0A6I0ETB4_9FIRM|nr:phage holin family protein [Heliorestis acidaminivorans]KAB2952298.1 phage holin family protein [Heliorestis acidaminivorans]